MGPTSNRNLDSRSGPKGGPTQKIRPKLLLEKALSGIIRSTFPILFSKNNRVLLNFQENTHILDEI